MSDHVESARDWLKSDQPATAQVHATLALVEQQRIANLIALAHADTHEAAYLPALQALTDLHQPEGKGWTCTALNPDIAKALGLGGPNV